MLRLASSLVLILLCVQLASSASIDVKKCKSWGFTGESSCNDCKALAGFVKDDELVDQCKKCCIKTEEDKLYSTATLEVCPNRLNGLSELKWFVDKMASDYKKMGFKVALIPNAPPRLRLKTTDGKQEIIRVDQWKRQAFVDFIMDRLVSAKKAKKA